MAENIISADYCEEMEKSYLDYSMSVITSRALPDARDGFKPVQRRIIHAMKELRLHHSTQHRKSARIVGDTMGKFHPHGDSSIYEAMVKMAQSWHHSEPIVDGHGNFGSFEGDGAAAMRYTEAKLSLIGDKYIFPDEDKHNIPYVSNYDETEKEPTVLPVKFPNLLVDGTGGIAVGMATSIPSHNIGEVMSGAIYYVEQNRIAGNDVEVNDLMQFVPGPDFATGGVIANQSVLQEVYETGVGKLRVRGKVSVEHLKGGKKQIVISEIPYPMVGQIDNFLRRVAELSRDRKINGITDIRNISSKGTINLCIELQKNADEEMILNQLYKHTDLECSYNVKMIALVNGKPEFISLKKAYEVFTDFQYELYTNRYKRLLEKEMENLEIREGLLKATDVIDSVIAVIRGSKKEIDAKECLMTGNVSKITFKYKELEEEAKGFAFTERQASAILEMRLRKLIGLEILSLKKEIKESKAKVKEYKALISSDVNLYSKMVSDFKATKEDLATPRRTLITECKKVEIAKQEEVQMDVVCLVDRFGYVRTLEPQVFERGKEGLEYKDAFPTHTNDKLLLFTEDGVMHQIKVKNIPLTKLKGKGEPFETLCDYAGEKILCITTEEIAAVSKFVFATEKGMIKVVPGGEFIVSRKKTDATKLSEGDKLVCVGLIDEVSQVAIQTKEGFFVRGNLEDVKEYKKSAVGCKAISLKENDYVSKVVLGTPQAKIGKAEFQRIKITKFGVKGTKLRL